MILALILTRIVSSDSIIRRVKSVKINKLTFQGVKLWGLCKVKYRLCYNGCQSHNCAVNYAMSLSKGRS